MLDPAYKTQVLAANTAWRLSNPDKWNAQKRAWRAANPDRSREIERRSRAAHPEGRRQDSKKRRARLSGCVRHHTHEDRQAVFEFYGWRCIRCATDLQTLPAVNRTLDHIVPLSRGGSDTTENLQPMCRSCNCRKSTKLLP